MKFRFTAILMLFVIFIAVSVNEVQSRDNVRTPPCDEVCHRTQRESESCCRAHKFSTGRCRFFQAFCDD
uniref:Uncharacterized protein n=1 Tax=Panagrolaimus sp. PS1159 TaxID=55785 RepID=A0AC35GA36_9BILA